MMAGADRPSPRFLSQVVMKGEDGLPSSRNLTTIFAFFGKLHLHTCQMTHAGADESSLG